jgi:hypothetical protein
LFSNGKSSSWIWFRYMSFDSPEAIRHHLPFDDRYRLLLREVPCSHPFVVASPRIMCFNKNHILFTEFHNVCNIFDPFFDMRAFMNDILKEGGEGVILRKPNSVYQEGASKEVLKFKVLTRYLLLDISSSILCRFLKMMRL